MTTTPDTVHAPETAISPAPLVAADLATAPTAAATGGPVGEATRTQARPVRPDMAEETTSTFQRVLVGVFVAVPLLALSPPYRCCGAGAWLARRRHRAGLLLGVGTWHHGRLPPVLHPRLVQGEDRPAGRARDRGQPGHRGTGLTWVSDHRRHHKYSDKEGDPHSPWRYGDDWKALSKGLVYAHVGWLFDPNQTSQEKFSPDLLADRRIKGVDAVVPRVGRGHAAGPGPDRRPVVDVLAGRGHRVLLGQPGPDRLLHHVTWSINSICHTFGNEDFEVRDKSRNVSWLAIASFGESWHNLHHADPTCARHGALKGQIDPSARVIWVFEKLGWAYDVRWPDEDRLAAKRPATATGNSAR
jgi:stearoyl-CoA desaturase (delta-9 desaturase)